MNKRDLVKAITERVGDRKTASRAVEVVVDTIERAVAGGERVTISGFGVFERTARPARYARNPATGERILIAESTVPKFRPGCDFKAMVNDGKEKGADGASAGKL